MLQIFLSLTMLSLIMTYIQCISSINEDKSSNTCRKHPKVKRVDDKDLWSESESKKTTIFFFSLLVVVVSLVMAHPVSKPWFEVTYIHYL